VPVDEDDSNTFEQVNKRFRATRQRIREIEAKARGRRGGADAIGVREPRRPLPTAGAGYIRMELDPEQK